MFVPRRGETRYDWEAIRAWYELGHTKAECKERFGFANGAWDKAVQRGDIVPRPRTRERAPGKTRRAVSELLARGMSVSRVAAFLGVSPPTVCYHKRRLGLPPDERFNRRYDWAAVQRFYDEGHTITECQRRFGMARKTFYDAVLRGAIRTRPQAMPIDKLLVGRRNRTHLKGRLVAAGLKGRSCERCGISSWRGVPLSLCLHHVNGDRHDNRLKNLQLLCPNCHSQTPNFSGRNVGRARAA